MPFLKLDCGILDSSVWVEPPEVKVAWLTMLLMSDSDGIVSASVLGIARRACLPIEAVEKALEIFLKPDKYSKNPSNEGRRLERISDGFRILNFSFYRKKDYSAAKRMRDFRVRKKAEGQSISASVSKVKKSKRKDIDLLAEHLLKTLRIPLSDRGQTETLLQSFGLDEMLAAVDRMGRYFAEVKKNKWTEYVIGKHWRNLYEKLEYFSSDENLENKLRETARANTSQIKIDGRTVSSDFSSDEELMRRQREGKNVQS